MYLHKVDTYPKGVRGWKTLGKYYININLLIFKFRYLYFDYNALNLYRIGTNVGY